MSTHSASAKAKPFEQYLYHLGCKAKLPFSLVRAIDEGYDFFRNPGDYLERRNLAKKLCATSRWAATLKPEKGYALFSPETMPAIDKVLAVAKDIKENYPERLDYENRETAPFRNIISASDLSRWPGLLEFALNDQLVEAVTGYLGTVPRLSGVRMWYTKAGPNMAKGSGLWHLDKPEVNYVQFFICLSDVGPTNGPLTALDATQSASLVDKTRYIDRSYLGNGRLGDDEVFKYYNESDFVRLMGKAGTAALVDTSTCMHYGGRCEEGHRWMASFQYAPAHRVADSQARNYSHAITPSTSQLHRLLLSGGVPAIAGMETQAEY